MKKSRALKSLTLLSFVILLSGFIAFKSGKFDKYLKTESKDQIHENGQLGNLESLLVDTPPAKTVDTTRINPAMMSTSKSGVVIDQNLKFPIKDTVKKDSIMLTPEK